MAIAIFKAAPMQNNICFRVGHAVAYYEDNAFQIYPIMIFAVYANIGIQGVPKNALSECCWNHSALAQAQVTVTRPLVSGN